MANRSKIPFFIIIQFIIKIGQTSLHAFFSDPNFSHVVPIDLT
jgi:hypothetical protein